MNNFGNAVDMTYDFDQQVVRLNVDQDGTIIHCAISRAAIDDHFGSPKLDKARLGAARGHFDQITEVIGHKITIGAFEPDGGILIRSVDLDFRLT